MIDLKVEEETYLVGSIVRSIKGHDKGKFYIVIDFSSNRLLLSDGQHHKIDKVKHKNKKHVELYMENKGLSQRCMEFFKIDKALLTLEDCRQINARLRKMIQTSKIKEKQNV